MRKLTSEQKLQKVIIVDSDTFRPMFWDGDQFIFMNPIPVTSRRVKGDTVKVYTRQDALQLIEANNKYRVENGFSQNGFMLMLASNAKGTYGR